MLISGGLITPERGGKEIDVKRDTDWWIDEYINK